jgi:hypothetical protein
VWGQRTLDAPLLVSALKSLFCVLCLSNAYSHRPAVFQDTQSLLEHIRQPSVLVEHAHCVLPLEN